MSETIENVVTYAIGAMGGIVFGLIINSFDPRLVEAIDKYDFVVITILLGLLGASLFLLHHRKKAFERNKKLRDETVALVTHEMRTGLTSTGWAIEVILENYEGKLDAKDFQMLRDVTKSINTTVMHSVNLLDVSLLDIGKLMISLKWIRLEDIGKEFTEIFEKYRLGAVQKGITFNSDIKLDKDEWIEADMLRLRIMVENLLENALQYTTGETKRIDVSVTNNAYELEISVRDTGIGIPDTEKGKIFSEFFRASNARKLLSTGSGIGLHMCYEYTHAHHGKISFESKENEGTTFRITIPLKSSANVNEFLEKI